MTDAENYRVQKFGTPDDTCKADDLGTNQGNLPSLAGPPMGQRCETAVTTLAVPSK